MAEFLQGRDNELFILARSRYVTRHHGKREEQMKALVSRGKATFERYLECARAWDSPLVRSVAAACPRTKGEVGERLKT